MKSLEGRTVPCLRSKHCLKSFPYLKFISRKKWQHSLIFSECWLLISLNTLLCRIHCCTKRFNTEWRVKNLSFSLILNSCLHCQFKMCPSSSRSRNVHIHIRHTFLFVLYNRIILLWLFILVLSDLSKSVHMGLPHS